MKNNKKYGFLFALLLWFMGIAAHAAPFEVAVSPSRFELTGNSGERLGQSIQIQNLGRSNTILRLRTLDWMYSAQGKVDYYEALQPGSCRPWVTLERSSLQLRAKEKRTFRFQLDIPASASRMECRFMLAVEALEPAHRTQLESGGASLDLPVSGRIAVAVYVSLNGAESKLQLKKLSMGEVNGKRVPLVTVSNTGDAHGRLSGVLDAEDANGWRFEMGPEGTPIMPNQTRTLPLLVNREPSEAKREVAFPLKTSGQLDWENGSFQLSVEFK